MFNKIVNLNHIITKFTALVPHSFVIAYSNFVKKRTTFAEVTLKQRMDPCSRMSDDRPLFKRSVS